MSAESKARDDVAALGAKLAARGLCPGTSGNISVKIADGWLMTPTNSSLGELDPGKLSKLDQNGKHVGGDPPTKEALLHRSVLTCGRRTAPSCIFIAPMRSPSPASIRRAITARRRPCRRSRRTS